MTTEALRENGDELNLRGQRFGPKGRKVRDSLLQAAREVMAANPHSIPTLTSVTAAAGVKITSVYRYYPDVNALLADAMQPMVKAKSPAIDLLEQDWPKGTEFHRAHEFSNMLYNYWRDRRGVLFVRNSLAEMGEPAFVKLRLDWARPMLTAFATKLGRAHGREPIHPIDMATARILISGHERTITMLLQSQSLGKEVVSEDVPDSYAVSLEIQEAFAHLVATLLTHDCLEA